MAMWEGCIMANAGEFAMSYPETEEVLAKIKEIINDLKRLNEWFEGEISRLNNIIVDGEKPYADLIRNYQIIVDDNAKDIITLQQLSYTISYLMETTQATDKYLTQCIRDTFPEYFEYTIQNTSEKISDEAQQKLDMLWAASMANIRYDSSGSPVINSASDYLAYQTAREKLVESAHNVNNNLFNIVKENYTGTKSLENASFYTTNFVKTKNGVVAQSNGSSFVYAFTNEFDEFLEETVNNSVDNAVEYISNSDGYFTEEDGERLKDILPYVVKGMGASESAWCSDSPYYSLGVGDTQSFTGLTYFGLDAMNENAFSTFGTYACSTDVSDYNTVEKSIQMSVDMYVHMVAVKMSKDQTISVNDAFLDAELMYTGGDTSGAKECTAYQMSMMDEFYGEDNNGEALFKDSAENFVANAVDNGYVSYDENNIPSNISVVSPDSSDYAQIK